MAMDDCFIPFHSPLREPTPYDRWGKDPPPCWSQLDLDKCAVVAGGSQGQAVDRRILQYLNRPVAVPPRRLPPPLGPLPQASPGSEQPLNKLNLPEEPKQHHPAQAALSSAASRGRYARSRAGLASKDMSPQSIWSRAGWASKERSTPEGVNMEEHGFRFRFTFPRPKYEYGADFGEEEECLPRQRIPPEVRNALRKKRVAFREKAARHHAKVALRKYNRVNNTKFELVEVPVIRWFWEFGGAASITTSQLSQRIISIILLVLTAPSSSSLRSTPLSMARMMWSCAVSLGKMIMGIAMAARATSQLLCILTAKHMAVVVVRALILLVQTAAQTVINKQHLELGGRIWLAWLISLNLCMAR